MVLFTFPHQTSLKLGSCVSRWHKSLLVVTIKQPGMPSLEGNSRLHNTGDRTAGQVKATVKRMIREKVTSIPQFQNAAAKDRTLVTAL
ncbi:hypothetical protein AgCh_014116 [Apium graveolens]